MPLGRSLAFLVKILVEAVHKPGSVPGAGYPSPGDGHSSGTAVTGSLKQPTRRHGRAALSASLFGLAPDGVYLASGVAVGPGELLPHPFTLTCRGRRTSLCGTLPWGRPRWTLSSVMPYGARTFLPFEKERPSVLLQPNCSLAHSPRERWTKPLLMLHRHPGYWAAGCSFRINTRWQCGQLISSSPL